MPGSNPTRANLLILVVLLFFQLLVMAGSVRGSEGSTLLERGVGSLSEPFLGAARLVASGVQGPASVLRDLRSVRGENSRLRYEVSRLRLENDGLREKAQETERLRRLLQMREDLAPRSIGASVITASLSGQSRMIVVDQGSNAGVRPDLPVVAWGGVVGRVVSVGSHHAKVRLITDPNSGVAGLFQRSRAEGLVQGRGDGPLEMSYVPKHADVAVGDRVVTSGLDGVFPRGFGIGRVTVLSEPPGPSKGIQIEPEVDFAAMEEVLVLLEPKGGAVLELPPAGDAP